MIISAIYVAAMCAANFSVYYFGPVVTPINAFLFIGLDLVLRDKLHERLGVGRIFMLITIAAVISFAFNPASLMIAVASVSAFLVASVFDSMVYQKLIRKPWMLKSNASNITGAAIDSVVFPAIAFGAFLPLIILGQFGAKVIGGFLWSWILKEKQ